jgi:outer membrane receptor protein involved in Fe transport
MVRTFKLPFGMLVLVVVAPVHAERGSAIEEIVVTAQKREESLADVAMAVQSISHAELGRNGIQNFVELVQFIPGASIVSSNAPGQETIQIRGISSGVTGDATVGYYIDDVPFSIPNLQLAPPSRMFDLERIEVLRGPSGTLYGQSSMGGTIKLLTAAPDSTAFFVKSRLETSTTQGGDPGYSGDLAVNAPIIEDQLAVRMSGGYEQLGGWVNSPETLRENINEADLWNARVKTLYTPTDHLAITLTYWAINTQLNGANTFSRLDPATGEEWDKPTMASTGGDPGYTDTHLDSYSLLVDWDLSFGTLVSSTSYLSHELDYVFPARVAGFQSVNDSTFNTHATTQELRVVSSADSTVKWIVGVYYRDAQINADIDFQLTRGPVAIPLVDLVGEIHSKSWATFGEASTELFDGKLETLVGLRYYEDDRHTADGFDRAAGVPRSPAGKTYTSTDPRYVIKYHATDDGMIYVSAAKGFRSGTTQTQAQVNLAAFIGVPTQRTIEPDEVWTYEIGSRWQLFDATLMLDGGIYYSDWHDIQLQFSVPGTVALANGGDAEIKGVDLALNWQVPIEGLTLQFFGNANNAEFKNVNQALADATVTVGNGEDLPNVPGNTATLAVHYRWKLPRRLDGFANAIYSYRANQIDTGSGLKSGSQKIGRLRLGVKRDDWELALFGNNLLDEDDPMLRTDTGVQFETPRTIGLELTWDW